MPVPSRIGEFLDEHVVDLPGTPATDHCQGALHHSPRPIVLHEVEVGMDRTVLLCGTCRDNLETLQAMRKVGPLPWPVRREFGNLIRALAGV